MPKKKLTLSVNEDVLKKARKYEINISSFLDIELRRYLALVEEKPINSTTDCQPDKGVCGVAGYHRGLRSL